MQDRRGFKRLPSYGAERWWLLSELKSRGTSIRCLDGSITQQDAESDVSDDGKSRGGGSSLLILVYLVWEQKSGLKSIVDGISASLDNAMASEDVKGASISLFIESHVSRNEGGGERGVKRAGELLRYVDEKYPNLSSRLVGVSDDVAACPALEECVVAAHDRGDERNITFLIRNKQDMLGVGGENREPDAVDGVSQWVVGDFSSGFGRNRPSADLTEVSSRELLTGFFVMFFVFALALLLTVSPTFWSYPHLSRIT